MSPQDPDRAADAATAPHRHEFGKTGSGRPFHKICVDLDRAWAACRLTGYERRMIQYIRESTWGVSAPRNEDARPCAVPIKDLALAWSAPRQRVGEALASLAADGMLIREGNTYRIGKDVWSWGVGRITPEDIEYCIAGAGAIIARNLLDKANDGKDSGTEKRSSVHGKACGTEKRAARKSVPVGTEIRADSAESARKSVHPHIRNAPASEDPQKTKEDTTTGGRLVVNSGNRTFLARDPDDWGEKDDDLSGEISAPVPPIDAFLATDEPTAGIGTESARSASEDEREDDRLRLWVKDKAFRATRSDDEAEMAWKFVSYWRALKIGRDEISAFAAEYYGPKLSEVRGSVAKYIQGIFKSPKAERRMPPVPPEWAPPPAPPKIYRPDRDEWIRDQRKKIALFERRKQKLIEQGPPDSPGVLVMVKSLDDDIAMIHNIAQQVGVAL